MGSMFAIQVKTGSETKAKEMLKYVLESANYDLVKGIYANETHTKVISENDHENSFLLDDFDIVEEDIQSHLQKESLRNAITNKRHQLEALERYSGSDYEKLKNYYKQEINQLEKELKEIRNNSKEVASVLCGYILVELKWNSLYLPDELYHLINQVPLVQSVLGFDPIPQEEVEFFFSNIIEENIEIVFEEELTYEEIKEKQERLLIMLNDKEDTNDEKKETIKEELDNLHINVVEKIKNFLENNETQPNSLLSKVKAFVKRGRKRVSMPLKLFKSLLSEDEVKRGEVKLSERDFIDRFSRLIKTESEVSVHV